MTESKLPLLCPSCQKTLQVRSMDCPKCQTKIEGTFVLPDLLKLSREEQRLMLEFVKSNGSPQRLSGKYNLSYPAIRSRLDRLIIKLKDI